MIGLWVLTQGWDLCSEAQVIPCYPPACPLPRPPCRQAWASERHSSPPLLPYRWRW